MSDGVAAFGIRSDGQTPHVKKAAAGEVSYGAPRGVASFADGGTVGNGLLE